MNFRKNLTAKISLMFSLFFLSSKNKYMNFQEFHEIKNSISDQQINKKCSIVNQHYNFLKTSTTKSIKLSKIINECQKNPLCTWSYRNNTCIESSPISSSDFCVAQKTESKCSSYINCLWDSKSFTCFPNKLINNKKNIASDEDRPCYATYDNDGCPKCNSRTEETCGWCPSLAVCAAGNEIGSSEPEAEQCIGDNWIFNQTKCDSHMCSQLTFDTCRQPCKWSTIRKKCLLPISYRIRNGEYSEQERGSSGAFIITAAVLGFAVVIIAIMGFYYQKRSNRSNQGEYGKISFPNLNDIPNPESFL